MIYKTQNSKFLIELVSLAFYLTLMPTITELFEYDMHNENWVNYWTNPIDERINASKQINIPLVESNLHEKRDKSLYKEFMKYWNLNRPESLNSFDLNSPNSSLFGFGDMNLDGVEDGVVYWMAQASGGNLHHGGFAVFINDGQDNFTFLDMLGPKDYTSHLIIENQLIYGYEDKYKSSDPRCCPSIKTAFEIRIENGKLQEKEVPRK